MSLQPFLNDFLDNKLNGNDTFADHGITQPEQFVLLCEKLSRREGVNIHYAELAPHMSINDLAVQVAVYKRGNAWANNLQPNPVTMPYAGLAGVFR